MVGWGGDRTHGVRWLGQLVGCAPFATVSVTAVPVGVLTPSPWPAAEQVSPPHQVSLQSSLEFTCRSGPTPARSRAASTRLGARPGQTPPNNRGQLPGIP